MKSLFFLLFILGSIPVFGQCAKEKHRLLLAGCASEQQKQEDAIALFKKSEALFDSAKLLANNKIGFLKNGEKKLLDSFLTYSGLIYQLKELESDLPQLIRSFKSDEVIVQDEFVEPIRMTLKTIVVFEKVSDRVDMEGLSRKEQNKVLNRKWNEYKRYALSNSIRQEEMKTDRERINAFLPRMDSLLSLYERLANEMISDSWKMQDKLKQLEASFRKKGPNDFPEVYFRIFPEVFPGFLLTESQLNVSAPGYNTVFEGSNPVAIEHNVPDYEWTEDAAAYSGGKDEMNKFIAKNLRYPESVQEGIVFGKVYVKFVVSEIGEISAIQVLKGISGCPECNEEAIRLVESMPNWIPGKQYGKAVKSYVGLPVKFEL